MTGRGAIAPAIVLLVALLAGRAPLAAQTFDDEDIHTITITVTSDLDNRPLEGARVWLVGPQVIALDYPDDYVHRLEIRGVKTDETGRVVVKVGPGTYELKANHRTHDDQTHLTIEGWVLTVPDPGDPERRTHQLMPRLKMKKKFRDGMKRAVTVVVEGRRRGADGRLTSAPIAGARVRLFYSPDGELRSDEAAGDEAADEAGSATFESADWFIGDILRVEASAPGFTTRSTKFAVGANPRAAGTTPCDEVPIVLEEAQETGIWLDIQVLDAETDKPVAGATVVLERVGGRSTALGTTDAEGKLPHLELRVDPNDPAEYRLKATHDGYEEKWDNLPEEYLQPSTEARGYTLFLSEAPPEAIGEMTPCERQAFEAFRAFALSKDPELAIRDELGEIHVVWHEQRERNGEMEEVRLSAFVKHYQRRDPRTLEMRVGDGLYARRPATIGGHEGSSDGAYYWWKSGRFDLNTTMGSDWPGWPTPADGKILAEQVAALVPGCP